MVRRRDAEWHVEERCVRGHVQGEVQDGVECHDELLPVDGVQIEEVILPQHTADLVGNRGLHDDRLQIGVVDLGERWPQGGLRVPAAVYEVGELLVSALRHRWAIVVDRHGLDEGLEL